MFSIAVIGSGAIGLPTALFIQKKFGNKAKIVIYTDKLSPNTTGDVAAGLWTPYLLQKTPQNKVIQWAKDTQDYILELWKKGFAKEAGISLQLMVNVTNEKNFQLPEWVDVTLGYGQLSEKEIDNLNAKYKENFTGGFSFVSFIWEASKFLPFLQEEFIRNGGEIVIKEIKNFEQLSLHDLIVNCTGLNSRFLVPDLKVCPIRGQIIRVEAPWQFNTFVTEIDGENHYIIPNQECVILGGTHQEENFNMEVDVKDKDYIMGGCLKYFPSMEKSNVIRHQVGLRPGREEVRLEMEERKMGKRVVKIVHNYGHGGSGVTLSIGCAMEAAEIAETVLSSGKSKL